MEWIKYETIVQAAKTGHIAAIKCSLEHWRQITAATQEEIKQLENDDDNMLRQKGCALCKRYFVGESRYDKQGKSLGCTRCPLREKGSRWGCRGGSLWSESINAFYSWCNNCVGSRDEVYWQRWHNKAYKLVDKLTQILEQAREKKKTVQTK